MFLLQKVKIMLGTAILCIILSTACSSLSQPVQRTKLDCRVFKKALNTLPSTPEYVDGHEIGITKREYFRGLYNRLI